jgi:2-polyprenyl-3-methyl-5-hydroxy-6-metoxy-1,4-benzoquinol methylase
MNADFVFSHTPLDIAKYKASRYELIRTEAIEAMIPLGPGQAVDVGSGPGYFTGILASRGWLTTAIDTDEPNIENARAVAAETHLGDAITVLGQLAEGRFDLALALEIIEHMPVAVGEQLLHAISRALKPHGLLLLSTPNRHSPEGLSAHYWGERLRGWPKWQAWDSTHVNLYSSTEIIGLVRRCGLAPVSIKGIWYQGYVPLIGERRWLPIWSASRFPLNRLGFNIALLCRRM